LELRRCHTLGPENVSKIEVRTFGKAARLDQTAPPTAEDAQYSIPYILATGLANGDFRPDDMEEERLGDKDILHQASKVIVTKDPVIDAQYPEKMIAEVLVTTTNGEVLTQSNQSVNGDWDHPLSDATLEKKFKAFTRGILKTADKDALIEKIHHLENLESMKDFILSVHHSVDCRDHSTR
jgi:2-methylcitrate dehydratase PrpD